MMMLVNGVNSEVSVVSSTALTITECNDTVVGEGQNHQSSGVEWEFCCVLAGTIWTIAKRNTGMQGVHRSPLPERTLGHE